MNTKDFGDLADLSAAKALRSQGHAVSFLLLETTNVTI